MVHRKPISYSKADLIKATKPGRNRANLLGNRPNKGKVDDIMNYKPYTMSQKAINGTFNGPELSENKQKVYLSVFHYLEYENIDPHLYETIDIGRRLSDMTFDTKCYKVDYEKYGYDKVNKYEYNFLKKNHSFILSFPI